MLLKCLEGWLIVDRVILDIVASNHVCYLYLAYSILKRAPFRRVLTIGFVISAPAMTPLSSLVVF
jgi:hypothetical protein